MGAASSLIRAVLFAPARPATVVHVVPAAAYLLLPSDGPAVPVPGAPRVLALLARDAVRLPLGLAVGAPAAAEPFADLALGDTVQIGVGQVRAGRSVWPVLRWWDPAVPRLHRFSVPGSVPPVEAARLPSSPADPPAAWPRTRPGPDHPLLPPPAPVLTGPLRHLAAALPSGNRADLDRAVAALVGLGPGLTPAGDDVLAGALAGMAAVGARHRVEILAAIVSDRAVATTTISAALLGCAAAGTVIPQLGAFLAALSGGDPDRTVTAARELVAVGHTSGTALAHGGLLGVRAGSVSPAQEEAA